MKLESLFLFGITPAAFASMVWGLFAMLKHSVPLKNAILQSLTSPYMPPQAQLRRQYRLAREAIIGKALLNPRRAVLSLCVVLIWIALLGGVWIFKPQIALTFYAAMYFNFFGGHPFVALLLTAATVVVLLLVMIAFDQLLLLAAFRVRSFVVNLLFLFAAYVVCIWLAIAVLSVCVDVYFILFQTQDQPIGLTSLEVVNAVATNVGSRTLGFIMHPLLLAQLYLGSIRDLFLPFDMDAAMATGAIYGGQYVVTLLAYSALLPMLTSSMFLMTIFNVSYFVGLLLIGMDSFLRKKLGYDQEVITKAPVEYLGVVSSCVAFAIVAVLNAIYLAISGLLYVPD